MKRLLKYLKDYKLQCIMAPLFKMLEALFELFVPLVMAAIIDKGIVQNDLGLILRLGLLMAGLAAIGLACSVTAQFFSARAATEFSRGLRSDLFGKIQSLAFPDMDSLGTSTMITRLTTDLNQVQSGVNMVLRLFLRSPFIVFGAMIMAFTIDVKAALIFVVAIPLLALVVMGIMVITMPMYRKVQGLLDSLLLTVRENLSGVRVIRAFGMEEKELKEFSGKNDSLSDMQLVAGRLSALTNPVTFVIVNAASVCLILTGAVRVDNGVITQGEVVALVNYMSQILVELIKLANLIVTITKALACANRIADVLELESTIPVTEGGEAFPDDHDIEFNNVGMTYPGSLEESLSDIDLYIRTGETLGIIGSTGCGKSTLVNLIPRFYDVTRGKLTIGGKDIKDLNLSQLRKNIGVVLQKAVLFKGTVRENMKWGNENASDEDIWQALETAQAAEFVREKEGTLDFCVEQGGRNLSGGQRQRLSIARALVRHPGILILDDSSSALDYLTDKKLRNSLKQLDDRMTVIIVSQRTASIKDADRIAVLEEGHMVGLGTHDELMKNCDVYREIYDSQSDGEDTCEK